MMEMMMGWIKEKRVSKDPNLQQGLAYEKNYNRRREDLPNLDHFYEKGISIKGSVGQSKKGYDFLIRRLETVEDMNGLKSIDANELILVSDLIIPLRFKIP